MLRLLFLLVHVASRRLKRSIQQRGSDSWPIADGQVFQAETRKSDLAGWVCELTYSYSAAGEYYSGTYERGFSRKKRAEQFAERFPAGTRLQVRYKPEKQNISAVRPVDLNMLLIGF